VVSSGAESLSENRRFLDLRCSFGVFGVLRILGGVCEAVMVDFDFSMFFHFSRTFRNKKKCKHLQEERLRKKLILWK